MKAEQYQLWDIKRILLGDAPVEFMLEVFLRTLFIFLFLLVIVRLLGKRMNAQLSLTEMSLMITLGAIVSAPMQDPMRGLLPGVVILLCALAALRGVNLLSVKSRKIELLVQGDVKLLVKDGVLQLKQLKREGFEREQVFAHMRSEKITQMGQVARVYLESCGTFSIYKSPSPKPGLSVLPATDYDLIAKQVKSPDLMTCDSCGLVSPTPKSNPQMSCPNCQNTSWTEAIMDTDEKQSQSSQASSKQSSLAE